MADFRKWFYALAVVALLAGLSIPASAQGTAVNCINGGATTPIVRAEGLTELMGDLVLNCSGGNSHCCRSGRSPGEHHDHFEREHHQQAHGQLRFTMKLF